MAAAGLLVTAAVATLSCGVLLCTTPAAAFAFESPSDVAAACLRLPGAVLCGLALFAGGCGLWGPAPAVVGGLGVLIVPWIAIVAALLLEQRSFRRDALPFALGAAALVLLLLMAGLMAAASPWRWRRRAEREGDAGVEWDEGSDDEPLLRPGAIDGGGGGGGAINDDEDDGVPGACAEQPTNYGTLKLLQLARPHRAWLFAGCGALMLRLPFSLSMPHFVAECISALMVKDYDTATQAIIYLGVAGTVDALLDFWTVYLFGLAQQRIIRSLRCDLFQAILSQEVGFFDATSTGEITSRLTADCAEMANDLTWVFRFTIEALVRIGGIVAYMFVRSWRLALLACAVVPLTALVNHKYARWMHDNQKEVQSALAAANEVAQEVISAMRTVVSFGTEPLEHRRYAKRIQQYYELVVKQVFVQAVYYMFCNTFLINTCVQVGILSYGMALARGPTALNPKILLAFMLYQGQLQEYFQNLFNSFTSLIKSSGAAAKVFAYMDRAPQRRGTGAHFKGGDEIDKMPATSLDDPVPPEVELRPPLTAKNSMASSAPLSVSFRGTIFEYPTRPGVEVLRGLSFEVQPGEVVALVGPSGSGKSTCFHLLEHFYEPTGGSVLLDGQDVAEYGHEWLHRCVALVGQEPMLLSGTIASNIAYGMHLDDDVRHSRIEDAARAANAHDFISALPHGYDTEVGERGVQLSGGQKQRIAIARCLIRDPSVLLLDEATSALDAESEAVVQQALERAMAHRTTLLIAHRLSTVRGADRIIVVDRGRVVEVGTHDELMKSELPSPDSTKITYRALVERQAGVH